MSPHIWHPVFGNCNVYLPCLCCPAELWPAPIPQGMPAEHTLTCAGAAARAGDDGRPGGTLSVCQRPRTLPPCLLPSHKSSTNNVFAMLSHASPFLRLPAVASRPHQRADKLLWGTRTVTAYLKDRGNSSRARVEETPAHTWHHGSDVSGFLHRLAPKLPFLPHTHPFKLTVQPPVI